MPDPKDEKKADDKKKAAAKPPRDLSKGAKTDVNLTQPITFNTDPTQIDPNANVGAWNAYSKFLGSQTVNGQPLKGNANLNSAEAQAYTQKTIDDFNNSDYVKQFPNNKMTPEQIKYAQEYHKRTDPNVQVDNWVGSQTSRFTYPTPQTFLIGDKKTLTPSDTSGFVPVVYGNKDYVIPAAKQATGKVNITDYVPYDPNVHGAKLQRGNVPSAYANRFPTPVTTNTTTPVIQQRAKGGIINKIKGYSDGGGVVAYNSAGQPIDRFGKVIYKNNYSIEDAGKSVLGGLPSAASSLSKNVSFDKNTEVNNDNNSIPKNIGNPSTELNTENVVKPNKYKNTAGIVNSIGSLGAGVGATAIDSNNKDSRGRYTNKEAAIGSNSLKGAALGSQVGSAFGPEGTLIGAGVGALGGAAYGLYKGNKDVKSIKNSNIKKDNELKSFNAKTRQEQAIIDRNNGNFNNNAIDIISKDEALYDDNDELINRMQYAANGGVIKPKLTNNEVINKAKTNGNNLDLNKYDKQRVDSMKKHIMEINKNKSNIMFPNIQMKSEGGEIEGEGGPKEDKIKAEVKEGSFVVPAENAELAKGIRKLYLKAPLKKAKLKQEGGEDVKLSDGEHLFTPEENEYLESIGVDLEELAPNADDDKDAYGDGGLVKGTKHNGATWNGKEWVSDAGKFTEEKQKSLTKSYNDYVNNENAKRLPSLKRNYDYIKNDPSRKAEANKLKSKIDELSGNSQVMETSKSESKSSVKAPVYKAKSKETVSDKGFLPKMTEDDGQFYSVPGDNLSPNERRVQTEKDNINNANAKKLNDSALAVGSQVVEVPKLAKKGLAERIGNIDPTLIVGAGQAAMGLKMLKGETRPIDNIKLDKAYNENVERSIKDASFGLTPEQKFQATQDIENAKRDAMFQGVNYSGGNASQAYNLNRSAINDAWKNKLGLKQADTDMRMAKQQYADQQVANRASVLSSNRRTMFNDAMEAFHQKQQAGSELVSAGLANSIGAYRFAKDQEERRKREGLDWSKNYQPPV